MLAVYTQAADGHLVEYDADGFGGHVWNAYDLSVDADGGSAVAGSPDAIVFAGLLRVYIDDGGGHLTEYIPDGLGGHIWNAYDVSAAAGGGGGIGSSPSAA